MFEYRYRPPFYLRRWFHILLGFFFLCVIAGVIALYVFLQPFRARAYEFNFAEINNLEHASIIYDRNREELGRIYVHNRDPIPLERIPLHMIQALVATEDARFFKHDGVDYMGIIRAALRNLKAGSAKQGASTITQQLARNAFELREKSLHRKLIEAFLARRIEQQFTKSEIMEMYLNRIYFGSGFYGINAAAKGYFGHEASALTVEEAATLTGLIKSPNALSPLNNIEASTKSRNYVFERMVAEKMLTRKEADELRKRPIQLTEKREERQKAFEYAYEQIRQQVVADIGFEKALKGGFHIYTTIDSKLQIAAHQALIKHLDRIEKHPSYDGQTRKQFEKILEDWKKDLASKADAEEGEDVEEPDPPKPEYLQGAVLAVDNQTGAIRALVGGRDYEHSAYDRAILSRRKPGTAFTPLVYASAPREQFFPGTRVEDSPIDNKFVQIGGETGILGEWGVESLEISRKGWMPARAALIEGKNAATVRYGIEQGVDHVVDFAKQAGISFKGEIQKYNSTFLGNSEASMPEMTLAYTMFPNKGRRPKETYLIETIRDADGDPVVNEQGQVIYADRESGNTPPIKVMDEYLAYQIHSALSEVVESGTAEEARSKYGLGDFPAAGKTGTAYEFKDVWFIGYTDKITCSVWAGFDRAKKIYDGAFSNKTVLPAWVEVMNASAEIFPPKEVKPPADAKAIEVCKVCGDKAGEYCYKEEKVDGQTQQIAQTYIEYINPRYDLTRVCSVHEPGGYVNLKMLAPIRDAYIIEAEQSYGFRADPVYLQAPTVLGEDPYDSLRPRIRPRVIGTAPQANASGEAAAPVEGAGPPQRDKTEMVLDEVPQAGEVEGAGVDIPRAQPIEFD